MHISLSTVMMAILTTSILLAFVTICLSNKKILVQVGYKLLALSVFLTVLRFALPFELPFTCNVSLPRILSKVIAACRHRLFLVGEQPVSLWTIFEVVWVVGAIISISLETITDLRFRYHIILWGKELTKTSPYQEIIQNACEELHHPNHFRVVGLPNLEAPMIFGIFSPKILIPEHVQLTETQLYYILRHEMTHHFHHDILIKFLVKALTSIYWWFRPCNRLNHQADVVLEMHVDDALTASDPGFSSQYMHCLLEYKTNAVAGIRIPTGLTMGLVPTERDDIMKRFYLLTNNQKRKNPLISIITISIVLLIYFGSYIFILEGNNRPKDYNYPEPGFSDNLDFSLTSIDFYIENGNGTYDFYLNGKFCATLDDIGQDNDLPIYTRDTCPYPLDQ